MDRWESNVSITDFEAFISKHGKRGAGTIKLAEKNREFYQDLQTKGGMLLVKNLMGKMEMLLQKNLEDPLTDDERALYKAYRNIFTDWEKAFTTFRDATKKIKENK